MQMFSMWFCIIQELRTPPKRIETWFDVVVITDFTATHVFFPHLPGEGLWFYQSYFLLPSFIPPHPNSELQISVGTAGPQQRAPDLSGHCRTSARCKRECQIECQKECQRKCQNRCQKECLKRCEVECQNRCQIERQIECQSICQKERQNKCQIECKNKYAIYTSRWFFRNMSEYCFRVRITRRKYFLNISCRLLELSIIIYNHPQ